MGALWHLPLLIQDSQHLKFRSECMISCWFCFYFDNIVNVKKLNSDSVLNADINFKMISVLFIHGGKKKGVR